MGSSGPWMMIPSQVASNPEFAKSFYEEAKWGAAALAAVPLALATEALIPSTLYHFTSAAGYDSIMADSLIKTGGGLFGSGVYASQVNIPIIAKIMGAQSTERVITIAVDSVSKVPTLIPGAWKITQDVTSASFK